MTNKLHTKVRLVKCPKCSKILPEPEQVPLYTCGGCGTILRAKYYRAENRASGLNSHEQVAAQSNGIVQARDGGESSSSSQRSSSVGRQSLDQNEVQDHNVAEDYNSEQIGAANSVHLTSLSENKGNGEIECKSDLRNLKDCVVNQKEEHCTEFEHSIVSNSAIEASFTEGTTVLGDKEQCSDVAAENQNQKCISRANSPKEAPGMNGSQVLESKELKKLGQDHVVHENMEAQQITSVNGVMEDEDDQHQDSPVIPSDNEKQTTDGSSPGEASLLNESLITDNRETVHNGLDSIILGENTKMRPVSELSHEKILVEEIDYHDMEKILGVVKEEGDGKARDNSVDCIEEQLERIKLSETSLSTEMAQGRNGNSTAGREVNSRAFRDAGEMGSCNDSQDPYCENNALEKVTHTLRENIEELVDGSVYGSEIVGPSENPRVSEPVNAHREDGRSHKVVQRSLTKGSLAYDGSISSFDGNDDQGAEQQERVTEARPELKNMAVRDAYSSSGFQNQAKGSSQILPEEKFKNGMLEEEEWVEENSIPLRNRTRPNRDGFMPQIPLYRSSELVYETGSSSSYMHDELPIHRMHRHPYRYEDSEPWVRNSYSQKRNMDCRRFPEAMWKENEFIPMYYNYETSGEIYHRSRHPDYVDRRRRAESWSLSGSLPRVHYSGEMFNGQYQMRDPYTNRRPLDLRWSAQMPPPTASRWDPYDSCPTSPRQFMEPEPYPWAHDAASVCDDQRHRDQIMRRLYLREKRQAAKRHCCPLAGGAPFVSCYFCFSVIQLPENFLLSGKRLIHRLKCGACSNILEFSLENGSYLAPCLPNDASEAANTNARRNDSAEIRSRSSRNEERMEEFHRTGGRSQSRKMKVTWQLPSRRSKSPLHRLMGYSSPHDMFSGHEGEDVDLC